MMVRSTPGNHPPTVTVGIPTYNRLAYLETAVASALAQTYPHLEILISQNPNADQEVTERIARWCADLVRREPRVRYQRHARNAGSPANLNSIAAAATGEYLMFMGDDDRLVPTAVERFLGGMRPGIDLVFSNYQVVDREGRPLPRITRLRTERAYRHELAEGEVDARTAAWRRSPHFFVFLVRTSEYRATPLREDSGCCDLEFFILLASRGCRFAFVPDFLVELRVHPDSASVAGLHPESILPHLLPIAVPRSVEPDKQRLLRPFMLQAVTERLLAGDNAAARGLSASEYYPRATLRAALQRACLALPGRTGTDLYRLLYRTLRRRRRLAQQQARGFSLYPVASHE